jgi:hypothetical protein
MDDTLPVGAVAQILAGVLVLFLGRRLFWVFVGVVGFYCGLEFGVQLFQGLSQVAVVAISIVIGLVGAGLAILLQRLAVAVAGGLAGGLLALHLAPVAGLHSESGLWVAFVAGALLVAVMLTVLFDPVLILLSSVVGALMITEVVTDDDMLAPLVFGVCLIAGLAVQVRMFRRARRALA